MAKTGEKLIWRGKQITGRDGITREVFTIHCGGRGWQARQYFVMADQTVPTPYIEIEVLEDTRKKNGVKVRLLCGGDAEILDYSKNPYVRVDGTSAPHISSYGYPCKLKDHYGAFTGEFRADI